LCACQSVVAMLKDYSLLTFHSRNVEPSQLPSIPGSRLTCEQLKDTKWCESGIHLRNMECTVNFVKSHHNEAEIEG
jgi:hypothetical protein